MSEIKRYTMRKGLSLPINGQPDQGISEGRAPKTVALLGRDYVGMKPTMLVKPNDRVKLGQPLFEDKKNPGVLYTSPGAGEVVSVNRGEKRAFLSVIIRLDGDEAESFESISQIDSASGEKIRELLVKSGLWTAIRTRPFSGVPAIDASPSSIFVSALDTNPLSADPDWVIKENKEDFANGLKALTKLTDGKVHLSLAPGSLTEAPSHSDIQTHEFKGAHPAGLVGTQIHFVDPVGENKSVWHVGYQDVIAIGKLLSTGKIWTERIVSLAGPNVSKPRLIRSRVGACLSDITDGELTEGPHRVVSGSVFSGDNATNAPEDFLGRYHNQVSVITEDTSRDLLGWHMPGFNYYSTKNVFVSKLNPTQTFDFGTNTNGSKRSMVPIGMYEAVMPLDILPTFLLRALVSKDLESAIQLGALELDEEDLGLCTFVCPGKTEYGPLLRDMLTTISKEG